MRGSKVMRTACVGGRGRGSYEVVRGSKMC